MAEGVSLAANADRVLSEVVEAARERLGPDLRSIVLFGSAAEDRLRATSDVNVIVVLARFDAAHIDGMSDVLRMAHAAVRLEPMFVLESEVAAASEAFAVKFLDVRRRHRVLFGPDPFAGLQPSREHLLARLDQVLLNLALRLRARYALEREREERLSAVLADAVGPLRASAVALAEARGEPPLPPREALVRLVDRLAIAGGADLLGRLSALHRDGSLAPGEIRDVFLASLSLVERLRAEAVAAAGR